MWRVLLGIVLIVAAVGAYFYVFERERLARALEGTPIELPATTTEVYKWRDERGRWHITDDPPEENIPYETMKYRSDDNVLPLSPRDP